VLDSGSCSDSQRTWFLERSHARNFERYRGVRVIMANQSGALASHPSTVQPYFPPSRQHHLFMGLV